jgi:hypothetical protein
MNELSDGGAKKVISEPMGDDNIRQYLPKARIIRYAQIFNYDRIQQLLTKARSYVVILVEHSVGEGHWQCLLRYGDTIEFFCSYGSYPDEAYEWNTPQQNMEVDAPTPYLSTLLKKAEGDGFNIIYNKVDYQTEGNDITTCGAYVVFRILTFIHDDMNLGDFQKLMAHLKHTTHKSYDQIVANEIRLR